MIVVAAVVVIGTIVAMASGRIPPFLALATGLAISGLLGLAPSNLIFSGLVNNGVITVACMLVIARGVVQTGIVTRATWFLLSSVETSRQALLRLVVPVGTASALINTTPIVAIMIPATKDLEQSRGISARSILLPIAHVTTLAGAVTLIGSSANLLIAGIAGDSDVQIGMFSFAPVALPVALVGWLAIVLLAPRLEGNAPVASEEPVHDWRVEIPIGRHALAAGRTATSLGIAHTGAFTLSGIYRGEESLPPTETIAPGDTLVFQATRTGIASLWKSPLFGLAPRRLYEVVVSAESDGRLGDLEKDDGIRVIAAQTDDRVHEAPMVPGDTFFLTGTETRAFQENVSLALWQDAAGRSPQPGKSGLALAILVTVIVAASFKLVPIELAAFSGAVAMVLFHVITPRAAVRSVDLNVIGILAGSIGLGAVVVESGLSEKIGDAIEWLSRGQVVLAVIVLVVGTTLMTNLVTKSVAAAVLTPIAIDLAASLQIEPVPFLAVLATSIAFTFLNPFSHQSNLMVMAPGGYTSGALIRFGIPIVLVVMAATIGIGWLLLTR